MTFDEQWWEQHYQGTGSGSVSVGPPSAQLVAEVADLAPGAALDAGCGTGADAVWLAGRGWEVTAVDISPTAVRRARAAAGPDEASGRISWLVADLTTWSAPRRYDLVVSQYVHPDAPFGAFVAGLARAVAPGGTLLVVGHDHTDNHSAAHAPQPASIGPDAVVGALDPGEWEVLVAESRTRRVARGESGLTMTDLVVKARRAPAADRVP